MSMFGSPRLTVDTGPGMTKQSMRDEVDINKIIAGFEKTGMINQLNSKEPFYGDVSAVASYEDALMVVMKAEALFMGMSADIRERFSNDPARMISYLSDPKNRDEAVKLGLMQAPPEPEKPQLVRVVPEVPVEAVEPRKGKKGDLPGV